MIFPGKSLGKGGEKVTGKASKPSTGNVKLSFNPKKGGGGECTVDCTITFDNGENKNDGEALNLMDENDKMETEKEEDTSKRHDKAEYNGAENEDSSGQPDEDDDSEMVEADTHMGTENSAGSGDSEAIEEGAKSKQVAVTPQSSVQEGTKNPVGDMSNATQHPSLPMPQMIPLPLFHISGESDAGSANGMTKTDTKKSGDLDEVNGESGYEELFAADATEGI